MVRKRQSRFPFLAVAVVSLLIAAAVLYLERVPLERPPEKPEAPAPLPSAEPRERMAPPAPRQEVAVLIDDVGYDLQAAERLARLPISCAVLPSAPHAAAAARILKAAGREIIVHLPMEPHSYPQDDPGEGALFTGLSDEEIRIRLQASLEAVPFAVGVNNHMGSRFMEDEGKLKVVMEELSRRGLFFVDSLTTPASQGKGAAARAGVPYAARSAFIDHEKGYEAARANLTEAGVLKGQGNGPVLLIGHPRPATLRALEEALPRWGEKGIRTISLSEFIKRQARAAGANRRAGAVAKRGAR